jgi:HlyD family secretion protein
MKDYKITKSKKIWVAIIALVLIVGGGGYYVFHGTQVSAQGFPQQSQTASVGSLVTIQPATEASSQVSASGNISLVDERYVALAVGATVESIAVQVCDQVKAGDLLLTLDTTALERAARQAELSVASQRNSLDQLMEEASASDIEAAQAELLEAQENLAAVQAGPSASELAAAQTNLSAAWAAYNELQAGPTDAELTQLSASLRSAEVSVAGAQTAYDQIAWKNEAGMTSEAADLQTATIAYESAKAAYD